MRAAILAIFIITISVLILFTSTDTITIFSGSHYLSDISNEGNAVKCTWCHSWVQNELNQSFAHSNFKCEECHRMTIATDGRVIKYAVHNVSGVYPGNQSHAAYTPRCLDCHGGNGIYYNDTWVAKQAPPAKAFNETNYGSDYSAHKRLVEDAANYGMSFGENEACIACHTNYSIEIEYNYFWNISYSLSSWQITAFTYNGTRSYHIEPENTVGKHEFVNKSLINCITCHQNIYEALVNGTAGSDEDYLTHSPIEISDEQWNSTNLWGNLRYHYILPALRAEEVNSSYCYECHNVSRYAEENPDEASTYGLSSVINDTNSNSVHAVEALTCATCHGSNKTKDSSAYHGSSGIEDYIASNYARTFNGDMCMGCHEAAVHNDTDLTTCDSCHVSGTVGSINIESEPSGYANVTV